MYIFTYWSLTMERCVRTDKIHDVTDLADFKQLLKILILAQLNHLQFSI